MVAKAYQNYKRNTFSIESNERKYVIDIRNQAVSEDLASSDSEFEGGFRMDEERETIKPNDEGILDLQECSNDEMSSPNGLFH